MTNLIKKLMGQRNGKPKFLALAYAPALLLVLLLLANNLLPSSDLTQLASAILLAVVLISILVAWRISRTMQGQQEKVLELHQNMRLLEAFFERSPAIMFVKDLDGNYILANNSFREFAEENENDIDDDDDLVGLDNTDVFPHAAARAMADQDLEVIEHNRAMEFQGRWPGPAGDQYFDILRFPLLNEAGDIIAVGGIANDRTEQILARTALRESEDQFRALIESAPDAVLIASKSGRIILANRQAENLFSYNKGELLKMSLLDLLPDIKMGIGDDAMTEDGEGQVDSALVSMVVTDSAGSTHPVEVAVSSAETAAGRTVTCLVRDVSDRTQLEAQLRQSQKMDAIGKLTGGMAHDFNNLLGVIMGNLDLASRKLDADHPILKRLDTAHKAAERGADLTKRMLAVARRQPLQPKPTNIGSTIKELADILPRTLGPDIEMEYDIKDNLPNVLVDPSGLENVFLNLAINSRDAMPNGGKFYITTEVLHLSPTHPLAQHEDMHPGPYVQIAITDTGEGMTKDTLARVFEPFFTTKERGKGTGLGLAMIYGFVKQSEGGIRISSEVGVGTTIDIFLPVSEAKAEIRSSTTIDRGALFSTANAEKVLVVDDESELLEVAVNYLEEMGFEVLAATDGLQALRTLRANPDIELLLTDIVMPGGMNGVELANKIREERPDLKLLYMSGYPSGVLAERSGTTLDAPLITKPYTREKLATAIDEVLHASA